MGEIAHRAHGGWACGSKACRNTFKWQSGPTAANYHRDRADSRAAAEEEGWVFIDGRTVRPFCPTHGPEARARADAMATEAAKYRAEMMAAGVIR